MEFDKYTIGLLVLREDAPKMSEAELDALQDAHLAHLAKLHEQGALLAAGPLSGAADRRLRGLSIYKVGPEEARRLGDQDPGVLAGLFTHEVLPWMVPAGALRFTRTRFPRSSAEAQGPSPPTAGEDHPSQVLHRLATGYRVTQSLYVVATLGVADLLADGPKTAGELARALHVEPKPLFRVLRTLASHGVFTQDASDRFGLAPLGEPLRTDHPQTVRHSLIMHGGVHYEAAAELLHTVRTGETGFEHRFGKPLFDYLREHPDDSAAFNAAMGDSAGVWSSPIGSYDFRGRRLVVDVGGGRGTLIATLLERNPSLRGILFDLPQGVRQAPAFLASRGVAGRCEIRTGNAFDAVPAGGDVYVFSRVLHDWPDPKAKLLLKNVRKAVSDGGILLLWEAVVPPGDEPSLAKDIDLTMLFLLGGAERTEAEWRAMLEATGFELLKVTKTGGMFDLIEARPV